MYQKNKKKGGEKKEEKRKSRNTGNIKGTSAIPNEQQNKEQSHKKQTQFNEKIKDM